jgi:UDP-N-acetylmuramate dehydrogenase
MQSIIQRNVSLKDKNWFLTGGNAEYFAEPLTPTAFAEAVQFAASQKIAITLLGEGANILIADEGIKGLTIRPQLKQINLLHVDDEYGYVKAEAGASLSTVINFCLDYELLGLHEFSGIPGSIGGAMYINVHYFEFLIAQFVHEATIVEKATGKLITVNRDWFNFSYDYSTLHSHEHYLVDVTFKLKKGSFADAMYAKGRRDEMIRTRARRYPTSRTCGSFFRNFFEDEVTFVSNGKKMIYVGYYLDKVGIKGELSVGDAQVSYQHANMIVNRGNASTNDIITLARIMQEKVYNAYGILPQPECQLLGFDESPLFTPINLTNDKSLKENELHV